MRALFSPLYAIWSHLICLYLATFSIVLALYLHQNSFYPYMPFVDYVLQCSCLVYASKFFSTPLYAFKVSHCLLNVTIICIKALLFLFYAFIWLCSLLFLTFICIKALYASHICFWRVSFFTECALTFTKLFHAFYVYSLDFALSLVCIKAVVAFAWTPSLLNMPFVSLALCWICL